jgi:hypothetical protein
MKFHFGAIPTLPLPGWRKVRGPGPLLAQCYSLPIGLLAGGLVLALWLWRVPFYEMTRSPIWLFVVALILMFPAHELLHVAAHPGWGRRSVMGVSPSELICYAIYAGELSRARFVVTSAAPFIGLTLGPLLWTLITGHASMLAMYVSVVNGFGSSMDLFGLLLLWREIPRGAVIRDIGWHTFWRYA